MSKTLIELIDAQEERCLKPHFSEGQYRDRQRIEDWNNGVRALARELRKVFREDRYKNRGEIVGNHKSSSSS